MAERRGQWRRELVNLSDRQITDSPGPFTPTSGQSVAGSAMVLSTSFMMEGKSFQFAPMVRGGIRMGGAVAILRFSINQMLLKSAPYNVSSHGSNQEMPELGHEAICYNI